MRKIAYLIGITGAGKSHIARQLFDRAHWIEIDGVQFYAGREIFPPNRPELIWRRGAWRTALEEIDCRTLFREALEELHFEALSSDRPLLIEGAILAWAPWRELFQLALQDFGLEFPEPKFFWLDPVPEQILANIQQRTRPDEPPSSLARVQGLKQRYEQIAPQAFAIKSSDASQLTQALEAFLFA